MKHKLGEKNAMYPMPVTIVGADVDGKANFITIAWVGIVTFDVISIGMGKHHFTNRGIIEHRAFSVNIPSEDMVLKTDYAGIASGKNTDKSGLFTAVYGQVQHAPMIAEAPVSMECNLIDTISHGPHDVFIGKIAGVYADENVVREGTIDLALVKPMLFDMFQRKYWRLGEPFADCWSVGKALEKP